MSIGCADLFASGGLFGYRTSYILYIFLLQRLRARLLCTVFVWSSDMRACTETHECSRSFEYYRSVNTLYSMRVSPVWTLSWYLKDWDTSWVFVRKRMRSECSFLQRVSETVYCDQMQSVRKYVKVVQSLVMSTMVRAVRPLPRILRAAAREPSGQRRPVLETSG